MGFNSTATTVTLTARLTPIGRQRLVSTNNALITSFSLGDSDANYLATNALTTGEVPAESGNIGPNSTTSNSTAPNISLKSMLILNATGALKKSVETQSTTIVSEQSKIGQVTITGTSISQNTIDRNDYTTDSLVNLFYSFGLPLNSADDTTFTSTTFSNNGYADTALSGIAQTKILVFGINNTTYGESLDGKEVRIILPTTAGTYTMYTTFQNKNTQLTVEDNAISDTSTAALNFGDNVAFLFSDDIKKPNGNASLSWGTGFGTLRPFSVNQKQLFNLQTNSNLGLTADTAVGIAYLDKGFLVITDPTIVNDYDSTTASATSITFNSVSTSVYQNITCIANRGEFGSTTNPTFGGGDVPRISEIGLYDDIGNLIAVAKTDRHVSKNINEFLALGIKILM